MSNFAFLAAEFPAVHEAAVEAERQAGVSPTAAAFFAGKAVAAALLLIACEAVLLPALVFSALASKDFELAANLPLIAGSIGIVIGSGLLAWPFAKLLHQDYRTWVPPMMFDNCGNMGLPLAYLTGRIRIACPPPGASATLSRVFESTFRFDIATESGLSRQFAPGPSA